MKKNLVLVQQKRSRRHFYVDDMLKSSQGTDEAVDLIQQIGNIRKAEGFNLTKFVGNKIEVKFQRKIAEKYIKIKELESEVQKKRALGVVWNIKTDTL